MYYTHTSSCFFLLINVFLSLSLSLTGYINTDRKAAKKQEIWDYVPFLRTRQKEEKKSPKP